LAAHRYSLIALTRRKRFRISRAYRANSLSIASTAGARWRAAEKNP
jgi:hypothetical protein